ncbi:hypothetical protein GJ744_006985 [Endocarpon pusillum]|uniref:Uncharacterized protein n=1 Tax=Endocarpon pusillum TaxID=364733 RepID=A0A8H7DZ62_9EURO|nr:hypothetical protein GJ744_006985 [Endocarpon pusillum]
MGDRIWKMDIKPYDQVLALTQHMINQGIDNLYRRLETGEIVDGAKLPEPAACYADENNFIEGVLFGAPTVVVKADYSNVRSVRFRILMKSGNIQLRRFLGMDKKTNRPLAEKLSMTINNWIVTVPVDVSFTEVDKNTPRGESIAKRSAAKGKPDHSIYELLMDLESMSLGNAKWEFGNWGEDDWMIGADNKKVRPAGWKLDQPRKFTDFSKDFQTTMEFCLSKISPNLMASNLSSMGFAIMAKDANKRATFEVNNTRYMTYPWTDPDNHNIAEPGLDGNGRLNYLLYLETVGSHTPPLDSASDSILSTKMGNWTEGRNPGVDDPSKFGSYVLSSTNFMDGYLIPKLSIINRTMSVDISNVTTWAEDNFFSYRWKVTADFGIGLGDSNQDDLTFKLQRSTLLSLEDYWQNEAKDFLRPLTVSPGSGAIIWAYKDIEWGNSAKHSYVHKGSVEVWMSGDTITFTRAYSLPGTNEIVYEGRTWTKFEYKIDPDIIDPNIYGKIICQCTWKIKLTMQEVSDGGMQFVIDYEKPTTSYPSNNGSGLDWIKKNLDDQYDTAFSNFEWYMNSIRDCLKGQEKFTLPASGVFYFKNPVINAKGDLVCGLEYNGNPELGGAINSGADERENVGRGDLTSIAGPASFEQGKDITSKRAEKK